jgi:ribosomal protein L13E
MSDVKMTDAPVPPDHVRVLVNVSGTPRNTFGRATVLTSCATSGLDILIAGEITIDVPVRIRDRRAGRDVSAA